MENFSKLEIEISNQVVKIQEEVDEWEYVIKWLQEDLWIETCIERRDDIISDIQRIKWQVELRKKAIDTILTMDDEYRIKDDIIKRYWVSEWLSISKSREVFMIKYHNRYHELFRSWVRDLEALEFFLFEKEEYAKFEKKHR